MDEISKVWKSSYEILHVKVYLFRQVVEQTIHKIRLVTSHCLFHLLTTGINLRLGVGREDLNISILYDA